MALVAGCVVYTVTVYQCTRRDMLWETQTSQSTFVCRRSYTQTQKQSTTFSVAPWQRRAVLDCGSLSGHIEGHRFAISLFDSLCLYLLSFSLTNAANVKRNSVGMYIAYFSMYAIAYFSMCAKPFHCIAYFSMCATSFNYIAYFSLYATPFNCIAYFSVWHTISLYSLL